MKITAYGGVNEIGGNKFAFEHKGTRILLDIGMSFSLASMYFDEFMQPRKCAALTDFFELGLLPDIKGLYRQDYLAHMGRKPEERGFDALFISHAHADHAAYLHFVRKDIPIVCSKGTYLILKALQDTSAGSFKDFIDICEAFALKRTGKGAISKVTRKNKEYVTDRKFIILDSEQSTQIGDLELKLVSVDHSLAGASALIIYTDEGNFVYTGDIRFHGHKYALSGLFVEAAAEAKPKLMLCEGTHAGRIEEESEDSVIRKANKLVSSAENLVVVSLPIRDTYRLASFLEVAKQSNRYLTISLKQAYLLKLLEDNGVECPSVNDSNIKIYIPRKTWGLIDKEHYPEHIRIADYSLWERQFLDYPNATTYAQVGKNQRKYILQLAPWEIAQLIDVKPKPGSIYIRSMCEPFDEEMMLDEKRLQNWLDHFKMGKINQLHASGHAPGPQLKRMLERIRPKELIPIHTKDAKLFHSLAPDGVRVRVL